MALIDEQLVRCEAAIARILTTVPENATGETRLEIALHELNDLEVFLINAGHMINVARNLNELRNRAEDELDRVRSERQQARFTTDKEEEET